MLNSFSGIGRLGNDPEVNRNNGSIVATFDLYVNEFYRADNELKKQTHMIPCIAYDRLAEIAGEFLRKGSQVGVRGPLKTRLSTGTQPHRSKHLVVHVVELEFLSSRQSE